MYFVFFCVFKVRFALAVRVRKNYTILGYSSNFETNENGHGIEMFLHAFL